MFKLPLFFALLLSLQLVVAGHAARLAHVSKAAMSPNAALPQPNYVDCYDGTYCDDYTFCCTDEYGGCCPDGTECTVDYDGYPTCS